MNSLKFIFIILAILLMGEAAACHYPPPKKKNFCCDCGAYKFIPRNYHDFKWYHVGSWITWTLFGNDDDGVYGEKPTAGHWTDDKICPKRAVKWWFRNPLHNFCFYVIGSAYTTNSEVTLLKLSEEEASALTYRSKGEVVFASNGTSFFLGLHGWKPFISLRIDYGRRFDFYFGWRERGNFGIKCVLAGRSFSKKKENGMIDHISNKGNHGRKKKV